MREVKLESGAILKVNMAPFPEAKELYRVVCAELKQVPITSAGELGNLFKDLFCAGFASRDVEKALWPCMARCTYDNLKVEESTFEPEKARGDFTKVCVEVLKENIGPFVKDLYALYEQALAEILKLHA